MSVSLTKIKGLIEKHTRASGPDFDYVFYASVNDVISDLLMWTTLDLTAIDEDDIPSTIDVDEKYRQVFVVGIKHKMAKYAQWAKLADTASEEDYRDAIASAQAESIEDDDLAINMNYDDDDDDLDED